MKKFALLLLSFAILEEAFGDGTAGIYVGNLNSMKPIVPSSYRPPVLVCPDGWTSFQRVKGEWCIKVFPEKIVAGVTEEACKAQNATLTGLENAKERIWIFEQSIKYLAPIDHQVTYVGGRRRGPCYETNWLTLPECMPKETKSFWWTDQFTTGDAGWAWLANPPTPDNAGPGGQSYAGIKTFTGAARNAQYAKEAKAPLDDYSEHDKGAYACGKRPDVRKISG